MAIVRSAMPHAPRSLAAAAILALFAACTTGGAEAEPPDAVVTPAADAAVDGARDGDAAEPERDAAPDARAPGPLPSGFSQAATTPPDTTLRHSALALDGDGDAALAWIAAPKDKPRSVMFTRWERALGGFRAPVVVAEIATAGGEAAPHRSVSLALDASSGLIAVAYVTDAPRAGRGPLRVAAVAFSSDGGATFPTKEIASVAVDPSDLDEHVSNPSVALAGGTTYLAYLQAQYRCGAGPCTGGSLATRAAGATVWTREELPLVSGSTAQREAPVSLAVDASGTPGVLYFTRGGDEDDTKLVYFTPSENPVTLAGTEGIAYAAPSASLAFAGLEPRAAFMLPDVAAAPYDVRFRAAAGAAWQDVIALPTDAEHRAGSFVALALDGSGAPHVAANVASVSGRGDCGGPLLWRNDAAGRLDTDCIDGRVTKEGGAWVSVAIGPDGKEVVAFSNENSELLPGIVVWKQP